MIRPISTIRLNHGEVSLTSLIDKISELVDVCNEQERNMQILQMELVKLKVSLKYEHGVEVL
ncbi:MAG: hypothetical protein M0R17_07170 [Candidatus Omnitrophica bacterium]|jgi:hypothetical protein|nr:hypothetical protein [Candidatus Omnitrophota bacterium]